MILSKEEEETIYHLAEKMTGSSQRGAARKTVLVHNIMRRIQSLKFKNLAAYLEYALSNTSEYQQLLSALTIHFTNWFRESDTFSLLFDEIVSSSSSATPIRFLCAACSTGEEVYSLGLFLESKRVLMQNFDYRLVGVDIDPISIATAKKAVYRKERTKDIPLNLHRYINIGSGRSEGYFTVDREIRQRSAFYPADLRQLTQFLKSKDESNFDAILCKNVLIYFDKKGVQEVTEALVKNLKPGGILSIGHSEVIASSQLGLSARGRSLYRLPLAKQASLHNDLLGRVLIVDDSVVIRKIMMNILAKCGFEVEAVESAANATKALAEKAFDLITLDLHMPEVDGITWLREQRAAGLKTPVVIVSDASPGEADDVLGVLSSQAQDYIEKKDIQENQTELAERLKAIVAHKSKKSDSYELTPSPAKIEIWKKSTPEIIVVGASTGGTEALVNLLRSMPMNSPPILVVQHISSNFALAFAQRLSLASGLPLGRIVQDEPLKKGHLYLSEGDYHIAIKKLGAKVVLDLSYSAKEHSHRPAIDVLFRAAARSKLKILGCLLTGMGKDGAMGLLDIKQAGGMTVAQDEESCVVYGMPKEAFEMGATQFVGNIRELRREIESAIQSNSNAA